MWQTHGSKIRAGAERVERKFRYPTLSPVTPVAWPHAALPTAIIAIATQTVPRSGSAGRKLIAVHIAYVRGSCWTLIQCAVVEFVDRPGSSESSYAGMFFATEGHMGFVFDRDVVDVGHARLDPHREAHSALGIGVYTA